MAHLAHSLFTWRWCAILDLVTCCHLNAIFCKSQTVILGGFFCFTKSSSSSLCVGSKYTFFQAGNIIGLFKVPNHCHKSECQHFEACSYFYIDCVICDFCLISLMYSLILSMLMNHRGNLTFISCHIYTPVKQEMDNI